MKSEVIVIMKKKICCLTLLLAMLFVMSGCSNNEGKYTHSNRPEENTVIMLPANHYTLKSTVEVKGRQGVCCEGDYYL